MRIQEFDSTLHSLPQDENAPSISDYLVTAFTEAQSIDILVGYFRVTFFHFLAPLLALVFKSGKKIRIICGHQLSQEEERLIFSRAHNRNPRSTEEIDAILQRIWKLQMHEFSSDVFKQDVLILMEEMISRKQLLIKPVVVRHDAQQNGLFHQKEYIFHGDNWISRAIGSANMTATMLSLNSESLEVRFYDLQTGLTRHAGRFKFIEDLWSETALHHVQATKNDIVLNAIHSSEYFQNNFAGEFKRNRTVLKILREIKSFCTQSRNQSILDLIQTLESEEQIQNGAQITLRPHQRKALDAWQANSWIGLFEMATGAGKTITAIQGIQELFQVIEANAPVFIAVPSKALVEQWAEEIQKFLPSKVVICTTGKFSDSKWRTILRIRLRMALDGDRSSHPIVIGIYNTLFNHLNELQQASPEFLTLLQNSLLIADECHSLGAPTSRKVFPFELFRFRIGLSATPDRYMDPEGTEFVRRCFDGWPKSLFRYDLSDAIEDHFLVPYTYNPIPFILDEQSQTKYSELTEKIHNLMHAEEDSPARELLERLLLARVRVIMKTPEKKEAFRSWIQQAVGQDHTAMIIYAPEGFGDEDSDIRIIEEYHEILHLTGIKTATFIGGGNKDSEEDSPLDVFKRGNLDALIAMKCLDEGVDLPRANCGVFLSSTGNTRQYVQRRGRLIRTYTSPEGDKKTSASIVDFICLPKMDKFGSTDQERAVEESILRRELFRASQFSKDALNQAEAESKLLLLMRKLGHENLWLEAITKN